MKLHNTTSEIFIPDGRPMAEALARITHLGIGAHQDDLEFMAFHGILAGYQSDSRCFGGVTCTTGNNSARTGAYANFTDAEMAKVRRTEQNAAAVLGRYGVIIQLDYASHDAKGPSASALRNDLKEILRATRPQIVYTHNPADKHDTHIAVVIAALQAMRALLPEERPKKVWGCEVWRSLDWLSDGDKVLMDVSGHESLATALNEVFDSQIAGGKRYDLAILGRRRANATFLEAHAIDKGTQLVFGMDLTPLVTDDAADIVAYVGSLIGKFRNAVERKLTEQLGR